MPGENEQLESEQAEQQQAPEPQAEPAAAPAPVEANAAPTQDPAVEKVLMLIDTMEPGESQHLATLLRTHPDMREAILAKAAEALGNETVAKALEILNGQSVPVNPTPEPAPEAPPAPEPNKAQEALLFNLSILEPGDSKLLAKILVEHPEMHDAIVAEATKWVGEETVKAALDIVHNIPPPEAQPEATPPEQVQENAQENAPTAQEPPKPVEEEAGWVVRARAYHHAHAHWVAEFNALTAGACVINGEIDPNLVATWQEQHGISPDGRVGPKTIEAARAGQDQAPEAAPPEAAPEAPPPPA